METGQYKIPKDARVVAICNQGKIRSKSIYDVLINYGYENVDYGGVDGNPEKEATLEMLSSANVIISAEPIISKFFLPCVREYTLKENQRLVQLDVDSGIHPTIIYGIVEKYLQPYIQK